MKLKDCKHGILVTDGNRVGMIVGIENNVPSSSESERNLIDRAIPTVQWSSGRVCGINAGNIEVFKG